MSRASAMVRTMDEAVAQLGPGPLTEESVQRHIAPLFSRVLASDRIYLANHSLGRPLDAMAEDVREATSLWETKLGDAWDAWLVEQGAFRARVAQLIHAPRADCVVPKTSAGQGLRTVLNALPGTPRVLSTRGEFDSIDQLLKQYASLGRIEMQWVEADNEGLFTVPGILRHLRQGIDLVVISQVMFMNGQAVHNLEQLAAACHGVGAKLLVDSYHAVGVFPVDVAVMCADFVIGGSYKYLRGGPGACFLYLSPEILASGLRPLDTGWFARENTFGYERHDPPLLRAGGDAFLESTPPVLTYYQARSGQQFTLAITVERLREYRQKQLSQLKLYLADAGINAIGGDDDHGAFDPATLLCKQGDELSCLTAPQVASLKKIYAGETDDEGHMIFPGLMPGDEAHLWKSWLVGAGPNVSLYTQGYFRYMVFDDPSWNALTAKTNAAVHAADAKTAQTLNATDPDLSLFAARGGKLILYHGWNDPAISPLNTVHYYEEVKAKMGDAKTADFLRLYMVPGMGHCAGGSGAAAFGQFGLTTAKGPEYGIFDALEKWEELDTAPGSIIATKYGAARKVEMTRPICPYPQIAKYNGNGDPNDSASFTCAAPGH